MDRTVIPPGGEQDPLGRIRRLYETADPVPPDLYTRVRFAMDLVGAERELAVISTDLLPAMAVRSGPEGTRTITFEADILTITVTVTTRDDGTCRLDGWAYPGGPLDVEVRAGGTSLTTRTDGTGRFVVDGVPLGEVQLVVTSAPGSPVALPRAVVTQAVVLRHGPR
jgi:hypothetical protein